MLTEGCDGNIPAGNPTQFTALMLHSYICHRCYIKRDSEHGKVIPPIYPVRFLPEYTRLHIFSNSDGDFVSFEIKRPRDERLSKGPIEGREGAVSHANDLYLGSDIPDFL